VTTVESTFDPRTKRLQIGLFVPHLLKLLVARHNLLSLCPSI
jgi:hypothetical protein